MNISCIIKPIVLDYRTFIMRGRAFDSINKGTEFYF